MHHQGDSVDLWRSALQECVSSQMQRWTVSWDLQRIAFSTEHHVSVSSHRLCAWDPTTSSTQICLHWCYAHLSVLLGLGTYAVVQCTAVARSIFIIRWSSDWWAGLSSGFTYQLMMFSEQNASVRNIIWSSSDNTLATHVSIISCHTQQVSASCSCIDVLRNWALYLLLRQMKQCLANWDLHHISKSTDDVSWAYLLELALLLCTSERCTGTGSSAHQSYCAWTDANLYACRRNSCALLVHWRIQGLPPRYRFGAAKLAFCFSISLSSKSSGSNAGKQLPARSTYVALVKSCLISGKTSSQVGTKMRFQDKSRANSCTGLANRNCVRYCRCSQVILLCDKSQTSLAPGPAFWLSCQRLASRSITR